jgi:hypothetical protein
MSCQGPTACEVNDSGGMYPGEPHSSYTVMDSQAIPKSITTRLFMSFFRFSIILDSFISL